MSYFSNSFGSMDKLTEHLAKLDVAVVNLGRHYNKHSAGGRNEAAYAQRVHQHAAACVKFGSVPVSRATALATALPPRRPLRRRISECMSLARLRRTARRR